MSQVTYKEIDEMIQIVDKNEDGEYCLLSSNDYYILKQWVICSYFLIPGKISYSEFRVMMGGFPLLIDINAEKIKIEGTKDKDKDENEKTWGDASHT